ncbi:hypothetical protein DEA8626_03316 [Defluviimonas aquaemixtae]|uniref:Uncharacterized protein n=1 Tax=Albidovulum aquaemixtae TaxID=1542388 RepID=A0A2R8BLL6_9RHOB|nr:hypothetical protein DEA8626_03316 [Defluviimonas aquaemixtae]
MISRLKDCHGSTCLAASVSGKERDKRLLDKAEGLVHFLSDLNPYRRPAGTSVAEFLDARVAEPDRAIREIGPDRVAAFVAEPVLASGGVLRRPKTTTVVV